MQYGPVSHTVFSLVHTSLFLSVVRHWSGLRTLASATLSIPGPHWDSSWRSSCCSMPWRSCSFGPAGHMLQQFTDELSASRHGLMHQGQSQFHTKVWGFSEVLFFIPVSHPKARTPQDLWAGILLGTSGHTVNRGVMRPTHSNIQLRPE